MAASHLPIDDHPPIDLLPVDPDVTLVRTLAADHGGPRIPINSLVITGPEPVLVDCGSAGTSAEWWEQIEAVVDPPDVRWIFLTHDDDDHAGNLPGALERCPDATVVSSWLVDHRLGATGRVPPDRARRIGEGGSFDAGGRLLVALRPPVYDSPSTRGLFDVSSGLYWAADCFGTAVPHQVDEVAELDRDVWEDGMQEFQQLVAPWVAEVEPLRWRAAIGRLAALGPTVLASAHGPLVRRRDVGRALDVLTEQPGRPLVEAAAVRADPVLASPHAS